MKPFIIPIFIPNHGCPNQCIYCDQSISVGKPFLPTASEISHTIQKHLNSSPALLKSCRHVQVAFYGGTFTGLPYATQKKYLAGIKPFLKNKKVHSIRLSTRPDYIDQENLDLLKSLSVKTIELGAQSMNDKELRLSKREYTAQKVIESSELIKKNNLELGIQLMPGLPGYTENSIMETSYKTCAIQPDFLRIYPALVIKNTLLEKYYLRGDYEPLFLNQAVQLCKKMLMLFQSYNIPVIRIGLQPTEALLSPGSIVAGPFHSAFHQLVISSIFYDSLHEFLKENKNITSPLVNFLVHPTELSNFIGHKKENINKFKKAFKNFTIRFSPDKLTPKRSFRIHNNVFPIIRAIPN